MALQPHNLSFGIELEYVVPTVYSNYNGPISPYQDGTRNNNIPMLRYPPNPLYQDEWLRTQLMTTLNNTFGADFSTNTQFQQSIATWNISWEHVWPSRSLKRTHRGVGWPSGEVVSRRLPCTVSGRMQVTNVLNVLRGGAHKLYAIPRTAFHVHIGFGNRDSGVHGTEVNVDEGMDNRVKTLKDSAALPWTFEEQLDLLFDKKRRGGQYEYAKSMRMSPTMYLQALPR